jgi:hypothetical protein
MSVQNQLPAASTTARRVAGGALGVGAAVTALTLAGAPWVVVAVAVAVGIAVPGLVMLLQVLVPQESEHKRDVILAWMRHRERRARGRQVPAQRSRRSRARP